MPVIFDRSISCFTPIQIKVMLESSYNQRVNDIKKLSEENFISPDEKVMLLSEALNNKGTSNSLLTWLSNPNNMVKVLKEAGLTEEELKSLQLKDMNKITMWLLNIDKQEEEAVKKNQSLELVESSVTTQE